MTPEPGGHRPLTIAQRLAAFVAGAAFVGASAAALAARHGWTLPW